MNPSQRRRGVPPRTPLVAKSRVKAVCGASDVGDVEAAVVRVRGHHDWCRAWAVTAERAEAIAIPGGTAREPAQRARRFPHERKKRPRAGLAGASRKRNRQARVILRSTYCRMPPLR
ncbi:hypothetical protein GCM10022380_56840 [Amycolatopsis tucumanensis]|uniref:Uncharacterized protein n=1 Tax=Amycolatopsis tucumanensis TaxID=401106 RepID=A0ABP7J0P6_9PSEU